ncbi:MAG: hypothetical protein QOI40_805, partial [Alphaproteobacteria bacterium]|nr:hypothetical protein [Alphaproteobacteria bacterium]
PVTPDIPSSIGSIATPCLPPPRTAPPRFVPNEGGGRPDEHRHSRRRPGHRAISSNAIRPSAITRSRAVASRRATLHNSSSAAIVMLSLGSPLARRHAPCIMVSQLRFEATQSRVRSCTWSLNLTADRSSHLARRPRRRTPITFVGIFGMMDLRSIPVVARRRSIVSSRLHPTTISLLGAGSTARASRCSAATASACCLWAGRGRSIFEKVNHVRDCRAGRRDDTGIRLDAREGRRRLNSPPHLL